MYRVAIGCVLRYTQVNLLIYVLATLELKAILAFVIMNLELKDIGVGVRKFLSPTAQPFVDNQAAMLPVYVTPVQGAD